MECVLRKNVLLKNLIFFQTYCAIFLQSVLTYVHVTWLKFPGAYQHYYYLILIAMNFLVSSEFYEI